MDSISDNDLARSRVDPRFKQILLAKALERLLAALSRMQHDPAHADASGLRHLRDGAMIAVEVADLIRRTEEQIRLAESA
jgi:hypothetical protein